jgi:transposase-like protein
MSTKARQRYTAEFKAQAVELISTGKPVPQIAEEIRSGRPALPAARKRPPQDGERHFKKSGGHSRHPTPVQLREMIGEIQTATGHGIRPICATLGVPRSSYYTPPPPLPCNLPTSRSAWKSKASSSATDAVTVSEEDGVLVCSSEVPAFTWISAL